MTQTPDAVSLLKELLSNRSVDRFDPTTPRARASLERILATPPPTRSPPGRPRRPARRRVVTGTAACVAVAAVALWPTVGGSPDVVARAAAALSQPNTILHFKANVYDKPGTARQISADPSQDVLDQTVEAWQGPGARQAREVFTGRGNPGGLEFVENAEAKTTQSYNGQLNQLITNNDPKLFNGSLGDPATITGLGGPNIIDDLQSLVRQAHDGGHRIELVGQTTIRGTSVYELRIHHTVQVLSNPAGAPITNPRGEPTTPVDFSTLVYVDSQTYLPVRIVALNPPVAALGPNNVVERVTDYVLAERLPDTPQNRALLQISPHPGATQIDTTAITEANGF